jgi:hypothetical protein
VTKVWLVIGGYHYSEGYSVVGSFSTPEAAQDALNVKVKEEEDRVEEGTQEWRASGRSEFFRPSPAAYFEVVETVLDEVME